MPNFSMNQSDLHFAGSDCVYFSLETKTRNAMMSPGQKAMLKALERELYPFLAAQGFQTAFDPESCRQGIFDFTRRTGETNHFLAIHFDRYREAFVLEAAQPPVGAAIAIDGKEVPVALFNHVMRLRVRLQAGRGMLSWFR